jgi:hypothetical protein
LGNKPSPPTATPPRRRHHTFQSRRFFTSGHRKLTQFQSLGQEHVATLAFKIKVRSVTGCPDF